jgi:tRNA (mo5U34)-methyltransferase
LLPSSSDCTRTKGSTRVAEPTSWGTPRCARSPLPFTSMHFRAGPVKSRTSDPALLPCPRWGVDVRRRGRCTRRFVQPMPQRCRTTGVVDPVVEHHEVDRLSWYHTMDLPGGITTAGRYDHRKIVGNLPWPHLEGSRCLDVGGRDGFFAFEMERRGAAEVVSLDIESPTDIDFPAFRPNSGLVQQDLANGDRAFHCARAALQSHVQRHTLSVYKLNPDRIGTFDFAVLGTLLLHLRDPVGALAALRGVLNGPLLVNEPVNPTLDLFRRRPVAEALMFDGLPFWWLANPQGLAQLLRAAGFEVITASRPYMLPNGPGMRPERLRACLRRPLRNIPRSVVQRYGVLHCWLLVRPASRSGT